MTEAKSSQPCHLVLKRPNGSRIGKALGLLEGDTLIAVNGAPFVDGESTLRLMFRTAWGKALALTFLRGEVRFTVLAHSANLGEWQRNPLPEQAAGEPAAAKVDQSHLVNWIFFMGRKQEYDLIPQETGLSALLFPPVWLLQMHLWQEFAAFVVAMMVSITVAPWVAIVIYLGTGIAVLQHGSQLFHSDRVSRGYPVFAVIAAESETEAHRVFQSLHPKARFIYSAPPTEQVPARA